MTTSMSAQLAQCALSSRYFLGYVICWNQEWTDLMSYDLIDGRPTRSVRLLWTSLQFLVKRAVNGLEHLNLVSICTSKSIWSKFFTVWQRIFRLAHMRSSDGSSFPGDDFIHPLFPWAHSEQQWLKSDKRCGIYRFPGHRRLSHHLVLH